MTDETIAAIDATAPAAEAPPVPETFYNGETEEQLLARGLTKTGSLIGENK